MKFKKISQNKQACFYALVEDVDSVEYKTLVDWLATHCSDGFELSNMHLILSKENELFFELTFPLI